MSLPKMVGKRASIFEELDAFDVSGFAPKNAPEAAPSAEEVRQVSEAASFRSREPKSAEPPPPSSPLKRDQRRYRTGRNVQFNIKASQETVDDFHRMSDQNGWVLGETLEYALAALRHDTAGPGAEAKSPAESLKTRRAAKKISTE